MTFIGLSLCRLSLPLHCRIKIFTSTQQSVRVRPQLFWQSADLEISADPCPPADSCVVRTPLTAPEHPRQSSTLQRAVVSIHYDDPWRSSSSHHRQGSRSDADTLRIARGRIARQSSISHSHHIRHDALSDMQILKIR